PHLSFALEAIRPSRAQVGNRRRRPKPDGEFSRAAELCWPASAAADHRSIDRGLERREARGREPRALSREVRDREGETRQPAELPSSERRILPVARCWRWRSRRARPLARYGRARAAGRLHGPRDRPRKNPVKSWVSVYSHRPC